MADFPTPKKNSKAKLSSDSESSDTDDLPEISSEEPSLDLMDSSIPLIDRIIVFLRQSKYPFPSRWIGEKTGTTKKQVNSTIYKNIKAFEKIECIPPLWKLKD